MLESVIVMLLYVCGLALVVYVIIWALDQLGIQLPPQIVKVLWVIVALIVLLWLVRFFMSAGSIPSPW